MFLLAPVDVRWLAFSCADARRRVRVSETSAECQRDVLFSEGQIRLRAIMEAKAEMFGHSREFFGSFEGARRRRGALAAAGASMLALAVVSPASATTTVTHSAKSGELAGGRLILHGVRGKVTWTSDRGHSGRVSVRRLHRRGFAPRNPAATGVLHVAGHRGGDEPTFKLSKPRYNRARRTVSYRAKPLNNKPLRGRTARAAGVGSPPSRFRAASLSVVPSPQLDGQHCHGRFGNGATFP